MERNETSSTSELLSFLRRYAPVEQNLRALVAAAVIARWSERTDEPLPPDVLDGVVERALLGLEADQEVVVDLPSPATTRLTQDRASLATKLDVMLVPPRVGWTTALLLPRIVFVFVVGVLALLASASRMGWLDDALPDWPTFGIAIAGLALAGFATGWELRRQGVVRAVVPFDRQEVPGRDVVRDPGRTRALLVPAFVVRAIFHSLVLLTGGLGALNLGAEMGARAIDVASVALVVVAVASFPRRRTYRAWAARLLRLEWPESSTHGRPSPF